MKLPLFTKLFSLTVGVALLLSSCSKKDEEDIQPTSTDLEEVQLSLMEDTETSAVEVPEAMKQSDNSYAQMAMGYVNMANEIGSYFSYFEPPADASKSNTPIIPSNGRITASKKAYLVYTWKVDNNTIAYQISDNGDNYVWEAFWKEGEGDYQRYLYAEESKTIKKGSMEVYDIFESDGELFIKYVWEKKDDGVFTLSGSTPQSNMFTITVNPDATGSVEYLMEDELIYSMEWDQKGNGNWTYYSGGQAVSTESWTV